MEIYDTIGQGYEQLRRADPRIASQILEGLGSSASVANVGAGAGSYEPRDRFVVAVEPSATMIRQRPDGAPRVVQARAGSIPFRDESFESTLAILTIHHWPDLPAALSELRRVARRRVVILTWDPESPGFWLADYFPEILSIDQEIFPTLELLRSGLGPIRVSEVLIPSDCSDGFLGAFWRRPEAYLLPEVRAAMSTFSKLSDVESGLARLAEDLTSGEWKRRNAGILDRESFDLGYRLVVAELDCVTP